MHLKYSLWLGNVRIEVQLRADLIPVGEALVLHARNVANQVGALLGHVVAQRIRNVLGQIVELREHRKGHHIQSGGLVAEEEWLAVEHLAEHLQIVLAKLLDLLGAVDADAVRLQLLCALEPLFVFNSCWFCRTAELRMVVMMMGITGGMHKHTLRVVFLECELFIGEFSRGRAIHITQLDVQNQRSMQKKNEKEKREKPCKS